LVRFSVATLYDLKEIAMRKSTIAIFTALMLFLAGEGMIFAQGVPWSDHDPPFSFLFDNHIDTHQQSQLVGNDDLKGFFYIQFTSETINGTPVAVHGQDLAGWVISGTPVEATLLSTNPLIWCVDPSQIPEAPGYAHFHWIGSPGLFMGQTLEGYLLKLTARATFYFRHEETGGLVLVTPGIDYASHQNVVVRCP
jgi:hypothetical protein